LQDKRAEMWAMRKIASKMRMLLMLKAYVWEHFKYTNF